MLASRMLLSDCLGPGDRALELPRHFFLTFEPNGDVVGSKAQVRAKTMHLEQCITWSLNLYFVHSPWSKGRIAFSGLVNDARECCQKVLVLASDMIVTVKL